MPRVFIKGGAWKNSEDEVLKAAVMKYGTHEWNRISSLIKTKTAIQCKARWTEWLDPRIKKDEWTQEEESKLLRYARLFPSQWRTICDYVGRTAQQCITHYEELLERAAAAGTSAEAQIGGGSSLSEQSALKLEQQRKMKQPRRGELDPTAHTKPARPDAMDMDDQEKEMLAETRVRLAKTQSKKEQRKARQKVLGEVKRMATIQRKRELKAAGVLKIKSTGHLPSRRNKWKGILRLDLSEEVPFEHAPVPGFYDTTGEEAETIDASAGPLDIEQLENSAAELKRMKERQLRERDKRKRSKYDNEERHRQQEEAKEQRAAIAKEVALAKKEQARISHRAPLDLPPPQCDVDYARQVRKLMKRQEQIFEVIGYGENIATDGLVKQFTLQRWPEDLRKLRILSDHGGSHQDRMLQQAGIINQEAMARSVLKIGNRKGDMKQTSESDQNQGAAGRGDQTADGSFLTVQPRLTSVKFAVRDRFMVRDPLQLNHHELADLDLEAVRKQVSDGLAQLPEPRGDVQLQLPEVELSADGDRILGPDEDTVPTSVLSNDIDKELEDRAMEQAREIMVAKQALKVSSAIQRDLPLPKVIDTAYIESLVENESQGNSVQAVVQRQALALLRADLAGNRRLRKTQDADLTGDDLLSAQALVKTEAEEVLGDDHRAATEHRWDDFWKTQWQPPQVESTAVLRERLREELRNHHALSADLWEQQGTVIDRVRTMQKDLVQTHHRTSEAEYRRIGFAGIEALEREALARRREKDASK
eukprot:Clim_evm40s128 gene=Clim_evmTU40s128